MYKRPLRRGQRWEGKSSEGLSGFHLCSHLRQHQIVACSDMGSKDTVSMKDLNDSLHIYFKFYMLYLCSGQNAQVLLAQQYSSNPSTYVEVTELFRMGSKE